MVLANMTITTHAHVDKSLGETIANMLTDGHLQTNITTPYEPYLTKLANQMTAASENPLT